MDEKWRRGRLVENGWKGRKRGRGGGGAAQLQNAAHAIDYYALK